jgi:CMP-N,N'-diacetyllegionaminic acid synthase
MKNTNVVALSTARAGSKSVPNKNIEEINGKPLLVHNLEYAISSSEINSVYISTDIKKIHTFSKKLGFGVIDRPDFLSGDNASHYETIIHGVSEIENMTHSEIDIVVVLLGNNKCAYTKDLDKAIKHLKAEKDLDSVISVAAYNMYNPFRAYMSNKDGKLESFLPQNFIKDRSVMRNINDKDSAGDILFFNGSFWVIRKSALLMNNGALPFTWLGSNIGYLLQSPECMEVDAPWQMKLMKSLS